MALNCVLNNVPRRTRFRSFGPYEPRIFPRSAGKEESLAAVNQNDSYKRQDKVPSRRERTKFACESRGCSRRRLRWEKQGREAGDGSSRQERGRERETEGKSEIMGIAKESRGDSEGGERGERRESEMALDCRYQTKKPVKHDDGRLHERPYGAPYITFITAVLIFIFHIYISRPP